MRLGYSTGTFDGCHEGQLRFLHNCRALLPEGSRLLIGLTTDELATRQKRTPWMSYSHRRAILMGLKGLVDDVVPHTGDDKVTAWKKLGFTDVFIGDEYYGSTEYAALESVSIPVHYIPRHPHDHLSSSELRAQTAIEQAKKLTIINMAGPGGPIYMFRDLPESIIVKSLRVSQREFVGARTANVYGLPVPPPRNFKRLGEVHRFPNLPGVNTYREIDVQQLIMGRAWCPTLDLALSYHEPDAMRVHEDVSEDWSHLNRDRDQPREVYFLYQKWAGVTLARWIAQHEHEAAFSAQLHGLVEQVRQVCEDLKALSVVHGDLHATNVCVLPCKARAGPLPVGHPSSTSATPSYQVTVIDFGWCLHRSFVMADEERAYYEDCLSTQWDWRHFCDAMAYSYNTRSWFEALQ